MLPWGESLVLSDSLWVSHTPAACSFPGENARSWEALGGGNQGPSAPGWGRQHEIPLAVGGGSVPVVLPGVANVAGNPPGARWLLVLSLFLFLVILRES